MTRTEAANELRAHLDYVSNCTTHSADPNPLAEALEIAIATLDAATTVLARVDHTNINTTIKDMADTWNLLRQHHGDTITNLQQMVSDRVTLHDAGLPIETRRRYDAYVWQMNDGRWHISECTNARLRGFPALPFGIPGFETEAEARAHLRKLEDELTAQR